jgi:hypothetical protein
MVCGRFLGSPLHLPRLANAKSRPEAAFGGLEEPSYFGAADAAFIAEVAALFADEAASAAAVAAVLADIAAEALASVDGVVTTVVVEVDGVAGAIVAGGVTVVVVSSFLLHAANETAAARVTISSAVFMFLLDFKFGQSPVFVKPFVAKSPIVCKTRKAPAFPVPNPRL